MNGYAERDNSSYSVAGSEINENKISDSGAVV